MVCGQWTSGGLERSSFPYNARHHSHGPHNRSSQAIYPISNTDSLEFQLGKIALFLLTHTYASVSKLEQYSPEAAVISERKFFLNPSNGSVAPFTGVILQQKKFEGARKKATVFTKRVWLDHVDATAVSEREEITLMNLGIACIRKVELDQYGLVTRVQGELHLDGSVKSTKLKLTWLPETSELVSPHTRRLGLSTWIISSSRESSKRRTTSCPSSIVLVESKLQQLETPICRTCSVEKSSNWRGRGTTSVMCHSCGHQSQLC